MDAKMLDHILEELRYIRKRLDDHVDDESINLAKFREDLSSQKTIVAWIATGVTIIVAGIVNWIMGHMGK
jgi:uncharacterized membrane protein YidH (DUF202 family)